MALQAETDEALEELERAVGLDPNDERARLAFGWELCLQGNCDEALQQAQAAAYFEPGLHGPHVLASAAHIADGLFEEALSEIEQARVRAPENPWTDALRAYALGRLGDSEAAAPLIESLAARARAGEISRVCVAAARFGIGQKAEASADLDAAFAARDPQLELMRLSVFHEIGVRPLPLS
jgi:Flp pilus assembly protein TadD